MTTTDAIRNRVRLACTGKMTARKFRRWSYWNTQVRRLWARDARRLNPLGEHRNMGLVA